MKKQWDLCRRQENTEHLRVFACYKKEFKKLCQSKKQSHEKTKEEFTLSVTESDKSQFWTILKTRKPPIAHCAVSSDTWFDHFDKLLNVPLSYNFYPENAEITGYHDYQTSLSERIPEMSSEIKLAEITRVVAGSPNKKAAGPDGITNEVLKSFFGLVFSFLVTLFNICFTNATCPVVWRDAYLKPLYKGKGEKTDPNSYRSISLLSCVYKCYSAILYNRLSNWVELQKLLPDTQYGFRKGRSTIFAAKKLIESIRTGIRSKKRYYVCYVDFEKAFDKLDRQLLFTKLQRNGLPVHFTKVLCNLYVQNNIQVCSDGYLSTK